MGKNPFSPFLLQDKRELAIIAFSLQYQGGYRCVVSPWSASYAKDRESIIFWEMIPVLQGWRASSIRWPFSRMFHSWVRTLSIGFTNGVTFIPFPFCCQFPTTKKTTSVPWILPWINKVQEFIFNASPRKRPLRHPQSPRWCFEILCLLFHTIFFDCLFSFPNP